jgi:hypothetical protein
VDKRAIRNEIIKCGKDPQYFIRKYVKIQHPTRGLIPFALFDYQDGLIDSYRRHRFNIILKARQLGISEITAAYAAWLMLFHRDKNILVMATKQDTAMNIIRKVEVALSKIPQWLMLSQITTDNKLSIELSNGSRIKAIASSGDAGRSEALSLLIVDEAAHIDKLDEIWTGLRPTVTAGGKVIMLSTPNGVGNLFHLTYTGAESGMNDFHPTKLMWWEHPERISDLTDDPNRPGFKTSSWYRNEIKATNMSPRDVAQELECNFNASGDTVISTEAIEWMEKDCIQDPLYREYYDRNLFVWHRPMQSVRYLLSADVARGDGRDFSAFHVFEPETMLQVAEYCGKLKPDEFAKVIDSTGREYNNALVVVENNNIGMSCLRDLQLLEYPNVYFSRKGDTKQGEAVNMTYGNPDIDLIPGFTTSPKTRPLMVAKIEEYLRNHNLTVNSKRLLDQLRTFIWHNGKAEAMKGYNDDLIMAAAIGCWIRETFLSTETVSAETQEKLVLGISLMGTKNTDIAGASKDPRFTRQNQLAPMGKPQDPMRVSMPNGVVVDLSWVIGKG